MKIFSFQPQPQPSGLLSSAAVVRRKDNHIIYYSYSSFIEDSPQRRDLFQDIANKIGTEDEIVFVMLVNIFEKEERLQEERQAKTDEQHRRVEQKGKDKPQERIASQQ